MLGLKQNVRFIYWSVFLGRLAFILWGSWRKGHQGILSLSLSLSLLWYHYSFIIIIIIIISIRITIIIIITSINIIIIDIVVVVNGIIPGKRLDYSIFCIAVIVLFSMKLLREREKKRERDWERERKSISFWTCYINGLKENNINLNSLDYLVQVVGGGWRGHSDRCVASGSRPQVVPGPVLSLFKLPRKIPR